jgi:hypothetical protein
VPVLLNGRLVQFYFSKGEKHIDMQIVARHYPSGGVNWLPRRITVHFERCCITHRPDQSHTVFGERAVNVVEYFYTCDNNNITFDMEEIPVVK